MILGPNPDAKYERGFVSFRRGSFMVLYTDGITEAARPGSDELYGATRLGALLRKLTEKTAKEVGEAVFEAAHDWSKGAPLEDDQTVVVLRRP
jgi:serine phosphatase RsbU (regulator of sigma subunit)